MIDITASELRYYRFQEDWEVDRFASEIYYLLAKQYGPDIPYLASYKGPATELPNKISHSVIKSVTGSDYSHDEIVFKGVGFSSSQRDGGVRHKTIDFNDGKWDLIPLPHVPVNDLLDHYDRTKHFGYDFWGLGMFIGLNFRNGVKRAWCSEWCSEVIQQQHTSISPHTLHWITLRRVCMRYINWLNSHQVNAEISRKRKLVFDTIQLCDAQLGDNDDS